LYSALQAVEPNWEVTTVRFEPQWGQLTTSAAGRLMKRITETSGAGRVWGGAMP
jgi:hypothetical protein